MYDGEDKDEFFNWLDALESACAYSNVMSYAYVMSIYYDIVFRCFLTDCVDVCNVKWSVVRENSHADAMAFLLY